jgi:hypothetical protein
MYQPRPIIHRALSIDAGSRGGLGIAISEWSPEHMKLEWAETLSPLDMQKKCDYPIDRYDIITDVIKRYINDFGVCEVVCEDIFCNAKLILAYRSLVLTLNAVRIAVRDTIGGRLNLIRANVAKNSVGVPANNGDKTLVQKALMREHPHLIIPSEIGLSYLDQHANDAVIVGYAYYLEKFHGS